MSFVFRLLGVLAFLASAEAWGAPYECDAPAPSREMMPSFAGKEESYIGREQAVGFYSDGSLQFPDAFPDAGRGFFKLFLPRNRAWGTTDLRRMVEGVAARMVLEFPSRDALQIGDVADERGGSISGHASHQNGLDVDLAYFRKDQTMQDPAFTGGFAVSFVQNGAVVENFDRERNWALVKLLAATGRVSRFFVNPLIKEEFCRHARAAGEYRDDSLPLRLLRPWNGHDGHVHVRLQCPEGALLCRNQEPVPEGAGCATI
ncbi:MAG: penicillin-insensitive murein endopeptidase [Bdellovibrionales bacterium]|nr:penicillin-insensitive murein endopeptidase [Bdellovibrionales bacterium]